MGRIVIVGAGAAGMATAIFTRRLDPSADVVLLDGARKPGAKILVSGGSRCNVTNSVVTERDFQPKTGSDGAGYAMVRALGHTIVPTTPSLAPLVLDPSCDRALHREAQGVAHDVTLSVWVDGRISERISGALLWTHFGVSGPAVLDASRHWLRARLEERDVRLTLNMAAGATLESVGRAWQSMATDRPRASVATALASFVPAAVASAMLQRIQIDAAATLAHLSRDARGSRRRSRSGRCR